MPFCTIVEFEWGENLDRERFERMAGGTNDSAPDGRLARITGIDDIGARVVEVWRSGDDARAFAEQTMAVTGQMPAPARVVGFNVTSYTLA
ncbi:MAG TPA: hypothetical protein VF940_26415 [Streptosporangiaceae bacterium]